MSGYKDKLEREKAVHVFTQGKLELALASVARLTKELEDVKREAEAREAMWQKKWKFGR